MVLQGASAQGVGGTVQLNIFESAPQETGHSSFLKYASEYLYWRLSVLMHQFTHIVGLSLLISC